MRQKLFEARHEQLWQEAETFALTPEILDPRRLPRLHRALCHSLSVARQRGYSPSLTDRLQSLALTTHRRLYAIPAARTTSLRQWVVADFPRLVRAQWKVVALSLLAFWGTALGVGLLVWLHPEQASAWMDSEQIEAARQMYSPHHFRLGRGGTQGDVAMFGFYIWNNVSIDFRTFAAGILGLPALISLGMNGVNLGVMASVLSQDANTRVPFWSFVVTHSSFEISGLILAGAAGLRLGWALLAPGRVKYRIALAQTGRQILPLLVGASLLTVVAAFFEGFWSAQTAIPTWGKFLTGGLCWSLMIAYFAGAGRSHGR